MSRLSRGEKVLTAVVALALIADALTPGTARNRMFNQLAHTCDQGPFEPAHLLRTDREHCGGCRGHVRGASVLRQHGSARTLPPMATPAEGGCEIGTQDD